MTTATANTAPTGTFNDLRVHAARLTAAQRQRIARHLADTGQGGQTHYDALLKPVTPGSDLADRAAKFSLTTHNPWSLALTYAA